MRSTSHSGADAPDVRPTVSAPASQRGIDVGLVVDQVGRRAALVGSPPPGGSSSTSSSSRSPAGRPPAAPAPSRRPDGWSWRSRCPLAAVPRSRGTASRRISRISFVSSTDRVVWVRYERLSGSSISTIRASSGLWTRIVRSGAWPVVPTTSSWPCVADQHDRAPVLGESPGLHVHLGDERAGRVDHLEAPNLRVRVDVGSDAVGGENDDRSLGHLGLLLDEHRALRFEVAHDVQVVHDLLADVDGRAVLGQRALDRVDGTIDAGAVAAGRREEDFSAHPPMVARSRRRTDPRPRVVTSGHPRVVSSSSRCLGLAGPRRTIVRSFPCTRVRLHLPRAVGACLRAGGAGGVVRMRAIGHTETTDNRR